MNTRLAINSNSQETIIVSPGPLATEDGLEGECESSFISCSWLSSRFLLASYWMIPVTSCEVVPVSFASVDTMLYAAKKSWSL